MTATHTPAPVTFGTALISNPIDNSNDLCAYDTGLLFAGQPSGNTIIGWREPTPCTPPLDPAYILPQWSAQLLVAWRLRETVYLCGPQGTGKTSAIKAFAARFCWPVYEITGHSRLEFPELCGSYRIVSDGTMQWCDGPLTSAMRTGGLFLLNECDLLDPATAAGLNSILDGSPLYIPECNEYIRPHSEFRCAFTANTNGAGDASGAYLGTLRQNAAFMSRMFVLTADYLPPDVEADMLVARTSLPREVCEALVEYARCVRQAPDTYVGLTLSPRDLIRWGRLTLTYQPLIAHGGDPIAEGMKYAFLNRVGQSSVREALEELRQRIFGNAGA